MKKLLLWLTFLAAFSAVIAAQDRTWQTFTPAKGEWSILSPGAMEPDEEARQSLNKRGSFTYKDFDGFFGVAYRDLPRMPKDIKVYYLKTRDGAVQGVKGKLVKEEEFTSKGITGYEIHIKTDYSVERARMFFHAQRFYVVLAVLPDDQIDGDEVTAYFNSFIPEDINVLKRRN